jgi:hypothetical protein
MTMIVKKFGIYASLGNLGLSLEKVHCSLNSDLSLFFSLGNNHVPEKEFKLLYGTT